MTEGLDEYGPEVAVPKPLAGARRRLVKLERKKAGLGSEKKRKKQPKSARVARTAKARTAALVVKKRNVPVVLMCKAPHWINGIAYGPGRVTVSEDIAMTIRENERRLQENNEAFDGRKAAFIGPKNRAQAVPYELFDSPMIGVLEAMIVTN